MDIVINTTLIDIEIYLRNTYLDRFNSFKISPLIIRLASLLWKVKLWGLFRRVKLRIQLCIAHSRVFSEGAEYVIGWFRINGLKTTKSRL